MTARFWEKCIYLGIIYIPALAYHFCVRLQRPTRNKLIILNYLVGTVFLCDAYHAIPREWALFVFLGSLS